MSEFLLLLGIGFTTGLSGAMIPGPLFFFTVSESFHDGHWAGLKIVTGHLILEILFVSIIFGGWQAWLAAPLVQSITQWVGGIGLVFMGSLILVNLRGLSLRDPKRVEFHGGPIAGGAFFSIASPGFILWWATIGASLVVRGALRGWAGVLMIGLGHALADIAWHWFIAFSVHQGKAYCNDSMYRLIMGLAAVILLAVGLGLPLQQLK